MISETQIRAFKYAQEERQYAINLVKCIVMPLNEEVIAFAEQDERGKDYRDLRIRGLKGEDVKWTLFDYEKCARDGVNYWGCQIDKMAKNLLSAGIDVETIAKASGLSINRRIISGLFRLFFVFWWEKEGIFCFLWRFLALYGSFFVQGLIEMPLLKKEKT